MQLVRRMGGAAVLFALLLVTLVATGLAALAGPNGPDVTGTLGDGGLSGALSPGVSLDTSAIFYNRTGGPITLLSAAVIPVAGYPTPSLAHVGLIRRPGEIGGTRGWPPPMFSPVRFRGATVGPGLVDIAVGLSAGQPGDYGIYGIRFAYRDDGRIGHVSGGPAEQVCVTRAPGGPGCSYTVIQTFDEALPGS